jgi:hypothetical protein
MIAMVIFAIVIASGFACLKSGLGLMENSRHTTRSSQIMQSEIERIRSLPWNQVIALSNDADVTLGNAFAATVYEAYTMERRVTGSGNERVVTLIVSWTDNSGRAHSRSYVSQYTRGGLYDYMQ